VEGSPRPFPLWGRPLPFPPSVPLFVLHAEAARATSRRSPTLARLTPRMEDRMFIRISMTAHARFEGPRMWSSRPGSDEMAV
jgi:hypothetical protein